MVEPVTLLVWAFVGVSILVLLLTTEHRQSSHPYLGYGDENTKLNHGAEWVTCPDCGGRTAIYKHADPYKYTTCGNCGADVGWDPTKREPYVESPSSQREPYFWR